MMKRNLLLAGLGGLAAAAVLHAPAAHADGTLAPFEQYAGDASWSATCSVLGDYLTGDVATDTGATIGVASALASHYGLTLDNAVDVVNYQVLSYCPRYWPNLVAVGRTARGTMT